MSTATFTIVDVKDRKKAKEEISKKGLIPDCDGGTIQVLIDTPFTFTARGQKMELTDNVDEMLQRVLTSMAQLEQITNTKWYIASSHPQLIERYSQIRPTQKEVNMLHFAEWCADFYFKMHSVWCHKYEDQRKKENFRTTEQLLEQYKLQQ